VSDPVSELTVTAWARLIKASQQAIKETEADLKAAGLPALAWYDVLLELHRADRPLRPLEIQDRLLLAQHNVSRLIDRLVSARYVERVPCADDGRGQLIALRDLGHLVLRRVWPVYRLSIQRIVGDRLTEQEQSELSRILEKLM
jgi:DNA-binding MarR family transcriptional regulator